MKKRRRVSCALLTMIVMFFAVCPQTVQAATPLHIVVLGDSIAKGYGLEDEESQCYGAIVAKKAKATIENYGINGQKSWELLERIQQGEYDEAIGNADVIFLSIGSNDLLRPFLVEVAKSFGVEGEYSQLYARLEDKFMENGNIKQQEVLAGIRNLKKTLEENEEILSYCTQFEENLEQIIQEIRTRNSQAILYVNNIYNPYRFVDFSYGVVDLLNVYQLTEPYIRAINGGFDPDSEEYRLVSLYSVFQKNGYTNVNVDSLENLSIDNFDPHPNELGHLKIAEKILEVMDITPPKVTLYEQKIKPTQESIHLRANEPIHFIEGKKLYLKADGENYEYTLTGNEVCRKTDKEDIYEVELPLEKFTDGQKLSYQTEYTVSSDEDAIKDKGNNSLQEEQIGSFKTEARMKIFISLALLLVIFGIMLYIIGKVVLTRRRQKGV